MPGYVQTEILIVDDKPEKILALEAVLADLSPSVTIVRAHSGREALRQLLTRKFAVILLDVNMPGLDGFETATLIRERQATENTPIIFITAFGDEPMMAQGYKIGAVDYIHTPFVPEVLRTKVQVFVELARKTEQIEQQARRLQQRAAQLSAMASELAQAEQRERRRLARLLHDHLQQLLVAARMRVTSLQRGDTDRDTIRSKLDDMDRLLSEAITASRTLTVQLSPPILYDAGLGAALKWLSRQMKEEHNLEIHAEADETAEPAKENVRIILFQAARELLFNIVKHAKASTASVTLSHLNGDCEMICLSIEDNGIGFDAMALKTPSANGTTHTTSRERFGLFNISERLALLDGRMDVQSRLGQGTRISLIVPSDSNESPTVIETAKELETLAEPSTLRRSTGRDAKGNETIRPRNGRIRVVVVDDHEILRKGITMLLTQDDELEVVGEAANGKEAVQVTDESQPDIVIMDVTMPVMNGIEATRQIIAKHPDIVVIGLSMHDEADLSEKMRAAGAAMYLKKGGPGDALLAAIRSHANAHTMGCRAE